MKVVNLRNYTRSYVKHGITVCDRTTCLGNPCSRRDVKCPICGVIHFQGNGLITDCRSIPCYRRWLWKKLKEEEKDGFNPITTAILNLQSDALLGCWCAPLPCHCDVLIKAAYYLRYPNGIPV